MNFREIFCPSNEFKESLWEKLQINIDGIRKVLIMNCFFYIHNLICLFSKIISILSFFV